LGDSPLATRKNPKVKKKVTSPVQREAHDFPLITFRFRTRSRCWKLVGRSVRIVLFRILLDFRKFRELVRREIRVFFRSV